MRRIRKLTFSAMIIVVGFTTGLILTEVVLRLTQRPRPAVIGWTSGRPAEQNEFGFRGHHFDARAGVRLVLLGDSQVEAAGINFDDMPEVTLRRTVAEEAGANVSVVSIGASSWGQDQELLALQADIGAIRPSAVVLWFTEGNDLWNNTFPTNLPRDGRPKPTFWLDGAEFKGPDIPWLENYRPPGPYILQAIRRVRGIPNYPTDEEWERHLPPSYVAATPPQGTPSLRQVLADQHGIPVDEVPYFEEENFETEKTHYSVYLVPESPRLKYAATLTRALLLRIRSLCEANGAKFFVLITERWDTSGIPQTPTMFEVKGKGYTLSAMSASGVIDRVLDGLQTIRVNGIPPDAVISKTDAHWSAEGNKYVMERVGHQLAKGLR
jgi:hypothetical protein